MSKKQIIFSKKAPAPIGPYSQAILVEDTLYISGQVALDAEGNLQVSNLDDEVRQVMSNIQYILEELSLNFQNIVKCSIFVKDLSNFSAINTIYSEYFKDNPPARETVEVSRLPKDVNVEISCIAVR